MQADPRRTQVACGFNAELFLSCYRARYYDPNAGRFISEDPIRLRGGVNFYRYVVNNPVAHRDPLGLCGPVALLKCLVGLYKCLEEAKDCKQKLHEKYPDDADLCAAANVGNPDDAYFILCFNNNPTCQQAVKDCGLCGIKPPFGKATAGSGTSGYPGGQKDPPTPVKFPPNYPNRSWDW